jgi:hypothetical protein
MGSDIPATREGIRQQRVGTHLGPETAWGTGPSVTTSPGARTECI